MDWGGVETANQRGLDARWIASDDGRWAIVEMRATRRERLDQALENRVPGARVLDPAKQRFSDLETEFKLLKRDFRWEQLAGAPVYAPTAAPKTAADAPAYASSGERAVYSYYLTDNFSAINSTNWQLNGSLTGSANGLQASTTDGGSVISKVNPGVNNYEISTTIKLNSGGATYSHFIRATSNARTGSSPQGTFYAVDLNISSYVSGGNCSATISIDYVNNGAKTSALLPVSTWCRDGMELRTVMSSTRGIHVFVDGAWVGTVDPVLIGTGQPGVGVRGSTTAGSISQVRLGALDTTAPTISPASNVLTVPVASAVDIQWQSSTDAGRGFWKYDIFRNGQYITSVPESVYTDQTVQPGTTYTYTITAMDYHINTNSVTFNVVTPPTGSIDQRRTGVRPTGSYWGAGGENVDLQSGNLNFTIPLLKALGRGKTTLPLSLSYNSQNWRKDAAAHWKFARDVGAGVGWRVQFGSITPYYTAWTTLHHLTFTDSSGAEYRLDRHDGNGLWTGTGGVYVTYDANTNRLRFNDGSYWQMDCESAGNELDGGVRFPTAVIDANGNRIQIDYFAGGSSSEANTSSRIEKIWDVRSANGEPTY